MVTTGVGLGPLGQPGPTGLGEEDGHCLCEVEWETGRVAFQFVHQWSLG